MRYQELAQHVGRNGLMAVQEPTGVPCKLRVPIHVTDAKLAYGRLLYLVHPIGGEGEKWVEAARVTLT